MKAFKSNKDCGHIHVFFFLLTMLVKEVLVINFDISHSILKGGIMDVVRIGLFFSPKAFASPINIIIELYLQH